MIDLREKILKWFYSKKDYKKTLFRSPHAFFRKALLIINPHSGTKKAFKIFQECKVLLEANGIYIDSLQTKPDPFLKDYIKNMPKEQLCAYDMICPISGDGSVHAILNGYFERKDIDFEREELHIAMIPGGSGCLLFENAIKKGMMYEFKLENSIYVICHPNKIRMKARKGVFQKRDGSIFSKLYFLYVHFGFIADVDLGSEKIRFVGSPRFEIYAYYKALNLNKIKAKVYIPREKASLPPLHHPI